MCFSLAARLQRRRRDLTKQTLHKGKFAFITLKDFKHLVLTSVWNNNRDAVIQ